LGHRRTSKGKLRMEYGCDHSTPHALLTRNCLVQRMRPDQKPYHQDLKKNQKILDE
jgi:hypothetical protein